MVLQKEQRVKLLIETKFAPNVTGAAPTFGMKNPSWLKGKIGTRVNPDLFAAPVVVLSAANS
jgi:hypothetical protein